MDKNGQENGQKNKCVWIHEIIALKIMKMKMKMENKSHRSDMIFTNHLIKGMRSKECSLIYRQHLIGSDTKVLLS